MNFDEIKDRRGTYCTQWDYVKDRFGKALLTYPSVSEKNFLTKRLIFGRPLLF